MPNWLLPEFIADVLPSEARKMEDLRRKILDEFRSYGYELVIPPMLEYLESLLTGVGQDTEIYTFKLIDQLSGTYHGGTCGYDDTGCPDRCAFAESQCSDAFVLCRKYFAYPTLRFAGDP